MNVNVENGTNAGWRRVRVRPDWYCRCALMVVAGMPVMYRLHPGYRYSCPDCGARRPKEGSS